MMLFSHANGFEAGTYRRYLGAFSPHYALHSVVYSQQVADYRQPLAYMLQHLLAGLDRLQSSWPLIGMGHSVGGILILLGYYARPQAFKKLIILDAPFFVRERALIFPFLRACGLLRFFLPPLKKTLHRRTHWKSKEDAWAYFKEKRFFKNFSPIALKDYVEYGLEENNEGVSLRVPSAVEARIFSDVYGWFSSSYAFLGPLFSRMKFLKPINIEGYFLYATRSAFYRPADIKYVARCLPSVRFIPIARGHMFPFEAPEEIATLVLKCLDNPKI